MPLAISGAPRCSWCSTQHLSPCSGTAFDTSRLTGLQDGPERNAHDGNFLLFRPDTCQGKHKRQIQPYELRYLSSFPS